MEYRIVSEYGSPDFHENPFEVFAEKVNSLIKEGWEPIGGVSVAVDGSGEYTIIVQAMIRKPKIS